MFIQQRSAKSLPMVESALRIMDGETACQLLAQHVSTLQQDLGRKSTSPTRMNRPSISHSGSLFVHSPFTLPLSSSILGFGQCIFSLTLRVSAERATLFAYIQRAVCAAAVSAKAAADHSVAAGPWRGHACARHPQCPGTFESHGEI